MHLLNGTGMQGMASMFIMVGGMFAVMYFFVIRPQRKEQKRLAEMIKSMEVGDTVETVSGFYGVIIDLSEEDIVVEFGSNKNCRIPMRKTAIARVEKAVN